MLVLRLLHPNDEQAFIRASIEWGGSKRLSSEYDTGISFNELLSRHYIAATSNDLPPGKVKQIQLYGFVYGHIVGRLQLRLKLTPALEVYGGNVGYGVGKLHRQRGYATQMMRQLLPMAWSAGMSRLLISCAEDNIASRRIIERFDGQLIDSFWSDEMKRITRRYWIER